MTMVKQLKTSDADFLSQLDRLLAWEQSTDSEVVTTVSAILEDVRQRGDAALLEYTAKFDRVEAASAAELELSSDELETALDAIDDSHRRALEVAADRVRAYAEHQKMESWSYTEADGTVLGQKVTPMDRAGLYTGW